MVCDVKPRTIYRLFDARGELLYIGVADDFPRRLGEHRKTKPWANEIAHTHLVTVVSTRRDIEVIEAALIVAERPRHNVTHNTIERPTFDATEAVMERPTTFDALLASKAAQRSEARARGERIAFASVVRAAVETSQPLQDADGWFHASTGTGPRALRKLTRVLSQLPITESERLIERQVLPRGKALWRWKDEGVRDVLAQDA